MLKKNSIPNSSLNKLKIYSSKGADELCMYHLANTPILKLGIFSGHFRFLLQLLNTFNIDTGESINHGVTKLIMPRTAKSF